MIFEAHSSFPENTIRLYLLPADADLQDDPILRDFPGAITAWEQIPNQKYRTLFGPNGLKAYLVKIDPDATRAAISGIGRKLSFREADRLATSLAILCISCETVPHYEAQKSAVYAKGAISGPHPLATAIGEEILQKGGNAIDAAVAMQFAMAVCYPRAGNIGGGGPAGPGGSAARGAHQGHGERRGARTAGETGSVGERRRRRARDG